MSRRVLFIVILACLYTPSLSASYNNYGPVICDNGCINSDPKHFYNIYMPMGSDGCYSLVRSMEPTRFSGRILFLSLMPKHRERLSGGNGLNSRATVRPVPQSWTWSRSNVIFLAILGGRFSIMATMKIESELIAGGQTVRHVYVPIINIMGTSSCEAAPILNTLHDLTHPIRFLNTANKVQIMHHNPLAPVAHLRIILFSLSVPTNICSPSSSIYLLN